MCWDRWVTITPIPLSLHNHCRIKSTTTSTHLHFFFFFCYALTLTTTQAGKHALNSSSGVKTYRKELYFPESLWHSAFPSVSPYIQLKKRPLGKKRAQTAIYTQARRICSSSKRKVCSTLPFIWQTANHMYFLKLFYNFSYKTMPLKAWPELNLA